MKASEVVAQSQYRLKSFPWSSHTVIAEMLREAEADSILDVGSDEGFLGQSLHYTPRELCAIDIQPRSLPNIYSFFWQEDLDRTDFSFLRNKTFNAIVLADVVEHLEDPAAVVSALTSHLKQGGFFIFSLPNMGFWLVRLFAFFGLRPAMNRGLFDRTHRHDFDLQAAERFFKRVGLQVVAYQALPAPLPIMSGFFREGAPLFFIYKAMHTLGRRYPPLFAYQLVFKARIHAA